MRLVIIGLVALLAVSDLVADSIHTELLPGLQQPISNNAVTLVSTAQGDYLYSFLGLGSGKTWQDISSGAAVLNPGAQTWTELNPVPGTAGLTQKTIAEFIGIRFRRTRGQRGAGWLQRVIRINVWYSRVGQ